MSIIGKALLSGARREGIEPGMSLEKVWLVIELYDESGKGHAVDLRKVNNGRLTSMWLPPFYYKRTSSQTKVGLFIDNLKGMGLAYGARAIEKEKNKGKREKKAKNAIERMSKFRENFTTQVEACAKAVGNVPAVLAVLAFLRKNPVKQILKSLPEADGDIENLNTTSFILFKYKGRYLHTYKKVLRYYWELLNSESEEEDGTRQCCLTGDPIRYAVAQGDTPTAIGYTRLWAAKEDVKPYQHYGQIGVNNFPMGREAAMQAAAYMQRLVTPKCPDPSSRTGDTLPTRVARLVGDDRVVFWSPEAPPQVDSQIAEVVSRLVDTVPAQGETPTEMFGGTVRVEDLDDVDLVGHLYRQVWYKGNKINKAPKAPYFVMCVSILSHRASITDFRISDTESVRQSIAQHYADLFVVTPRYLNGYTPSLGTIMNSALSEAERAKKGWREYFPARVAHQLYTATITGESYPDTVFRRVVNRLRREGFHRGWAFYARVAFIKAHINRQLRLGRTTHYKEFRNMLDETIVETPYLLGRLLAIGDYAQSVAYPHSNTGMRSRYERALMTTPGRVYVQVLSLVNKYLDTMRRSGKEGLAFYVKQRMLEILDPIGPDGPPLSFSEPDQIMFLQGYLHEAAEGERKRLAAQEKKKRAKEKPAADKA